MFNIALPVHRYKCFYKGKAIAFEAIILNNRIKTANDEYITFYDRCKHIMTVLGQYLRGL